MAVNKVIYGTTVLVDLTEDTVTADTLMQGYTAHDKSGALITGTASVTGGVTQDQDGYLVLDDEGGAGSSSYTLLTSEEFTVNTTSTSNITVGTIQAGSSAHTSDKLLYVKIRDKAGQRIGHFYGSDFFFANQYPKVGSVTSTSVSGKLVYYVNDNGYMGVATVAYGVFANSVDRYGDIVIYARYNSLNSRTIDGTFKCDVYLLDWPNGDTPFVPQIVE